jgi:hypothetical protein
MQAEQKVVSAMLSSRHAYQRAEPQQQTAAADVLKVISRSTLGLQMEIKERSKTMQIQSS